METFVEMDIPDLLASHDPAVLRQQARHNTHQIRALQAQRAQLTGETVRNALSQRYAVLVQVVKETSDPDRREAAQAEIATLQTQWKTLRNPEIAHDWLTHQKSRLAQEITTRRQRSAALLQHRQRLIQARPAEHKKSIVARSEELERHRAQANDALERLLATLSPTIAATRDYDAKVRLRAWERTNRMMLDALKRLPSLSS